MVSHEGEASGEGLGWIFWELCWWEGRSDVGTVLDVFRNRWMWCLGSRVRSGLGSAVGQLMINDLRSFSSLNESIIQQQQLLHVVIQLICPRWATPGVTLGWVELPSLKAGTRALQIRIPGQFQFGSCALNSRGSS